METPRTSSYTKEEIAFIKNNYRDKTDEELAEKLGRPVGSVTRKRQRLGCFYIQIAFEASIKGEQWKEFSDGYFVSDLGRIKSATKLMSIFVNRQGYAQFRIVRHNGKSENYKVHRLVAEKFCYKPNMWSKHYHVHHKDKIRLNNSAENLEWLSPEEHKNKH